MTPERWREVEAVVLAALDRAPDERPAFVATACGDDAELRHEVQSLLAARPATGFLAGSAVADDVARASHDDGREALQRLAAALAGQYVVERELGRGGMATVYLARDLRHRRLVALKLLHPELSAALGPERFLREIELTASLQHPHVLPLFDSGTATGLLWYVMPFVDGESLRARLARERQLPLDDAVRIAREVADALAYAHARGVVHRDVKPENILLHGSHALVADFGIALAVEQAARGGRMTRTGLSLGTPQYMAPEQASGERTVDARADVYALGAVLYEMLAGAPPFAGPSAQAVVARALTEAPTPLPTLRPRVPPHVAAAVHTALAKLPADRFPGAAAFAAALDAAAAPPLPPTRPARPASATLAAVALVAAVLGTTLGWVRGRASAADGLLRDARAPLRFTIEPDSAAPQIGAAAISPDGRTVVFVGHGVDGARLYARRLDELAVRPLPGTEDGDLPFFSPDGAWVGFHSHGALRRVRLDGGGPLLVARLAPRAWFGGGAWGADDAIVFSVLDHGLFRVSAAGGDPTPVRGADTTLSLMHPQLVPGGRAVLVTVTSDRNAAHVGVVDLATGRLRRFGAGTDPRLVAGHLVYAGLHGELYRQPFDAARLEPTGTAEQVASGLDASAITLSAGASAFDVSPGGTLVYRVGALPSGVGPLRLTLYDRTGRELRTVPARVPWAPRLSPDGRRVAYGAFAPGRDSSDLWITDLETGATQRLTADAADNNDPQWSPDGNAIAYSANADAWKDMFVQTIDGGPARRLLRRRRSAEWPSDWSGDGRTLLFTEFSGELDVWVQPLDGTPARPYLASPARERGACFSPDGQWVAYQSNETGREEVYLQSFPTPGHKTLISAGGGIHPVWRGDGQELFYWQADRLIAARLEATHAGGPPTVRERTPLFRAPYLAADLAMYDAAPDGQRFVLVTGGGRTGRLVVAVGALGAR